MSITCVGLTDNQFLVQSHIGQIIFSSTLDTEDKVKQLYGGNKWVKIEGKFLLGASDKYANGDVGGEETHVLSASEMPSHYHKDMQWGTNSGNYFGVNPNSVNTSRWVFSYSGTAGDANFYTSTEGGSQAHNNMPPYRTVYIWERTA